MVVLLITCVNVAGLMLARAMARQRETAIRLALGAARWRLARQLLAESLCLAAAGGLAGLFVGRGTLSVLFTMPPADQWGNITAKLNSHVLAFALLLTALTAMLCGLAPIAQAWRSSFTVAMKDQSSGGGEAPRASLVRKGIVVAQVALSMLLLVDGGLFARSLYNLRTFNPGFRTENLLTFSIDPELNGYSRERGHRLSLDLLERLKAVPGVESAGAAEVAVLSGSSSSTGITVEGFQPEADGGVTMQFNRVSSDYFRTMGIALLSGREFNDRDTSASAKIAVVNEAFERKFWGDSSALGKRLAFSWGNAVKLDTEIVGVVGNQKNMSLREQTTPFVYRPLAQGERLSSITFYLRTAAGEASLGPEARQLVRQFDANLPVYDMQTVQVVLENSIAFDRVVAALSVAFAALATTLAIVGLFGLMMYTVTQRKR
ncbi:MAG: ABC transporter permease, partial [bacterium]